LISLQQEFSRLGHQPPTETGTFKLDHTIYPWNSPIPLVIVEGSSPEMGKQFGKATKGIIGKVVQHNVPILREALSKSKLKEKDYLHNAESAVSKFTESEFLDEINAMAEASSVSYDSLLLTNLNVDILTTLRSRGAAELFSCDFFSAWGGATQTGSVVAGHNDDGGRLMDQFSVLRIAKPKHGRPFVTPITPGYIGYDAIFNDSPFFFCGTALHDTMKDSEVMNDAVPSWFMYRWIGQFSSGVEDAMARFNSVPSMGFKNWCFTDSSGTKIVEATPKHKAFVDFRTKRKDATYISNNTACDELGSHIKKVKHPTSGDHRFASMKITLENAYGKIGLEQGMQLLSDHYDASVKRDSASENTICMHGEYSGKISGTCRSLVVDFSTPGSLEVAVALGNPCYGYWRHLRLSKGLKRIEGYNPEDARERELRGLLAA